MEKEPIAMIELRSEPEGRRAEERIRAFVVDLERDGIKPQEIARALSRVLLGFCAEHARRVENYGWVIFLLLSLIHI